MREYGGPLSRFTVVQAMVLTGLVILGILAFAGAFGEAEQPLDLERLEGRDRITTAIAVSEAGWDSADTVVLATAVDFPDALAASAVAAATDAPLLLTDALALPRPVADEIERLGAETVYLLGGEGVIDPTVPWQLDYLDLGLEVERIAGPDRYATAAAAARRAGAPGGEASIALGTDFPDAVAASALAATPQRAPILLTEPDGLPEPTVGALDDLGIERVEVVGGAASDAVVAELEALGLEVTPRVGADRYATSVSVAEEALVRLEEPTPLVLASGEGFPDALAAGALSARVGGTLVLTPSEGDSEPVEALLREHAERWDVGFVVGGGGAITLNGLERLAAMAADLPAPPVPEDPENGPEDDAGSPLGPDPDAPTEDEDDAEDDAEEDAEEEDPEGGDDTAAEATDGDS